MAILTHSVLNELGPDPRQNIHTIVSKASELLKCDCAAYGCLETASGDLRFRVAHKLPARPSAIRELVRRICSEIISSGKAAAVCALSSTAAVGKPARNELATGGFKSFLGYPVAVSGEISGALIALHTRRRTFSEQDRFLIGFLAGIVAIEESCHQREEALSRRVALEKMLKELSTKAIDTEDSAAFIDHGLRLIGSRMGVGGAFLWEFTPEKKSLARSHAWLAEGRAAMKPGGEQIPIESLPREFGRLMKGDILRVTDTRQMPIKQGWELLEKAGSRACLIIPLFSQEVFYGCIGLECCRGPKTWASEDVLVLQTAAEIIMRCIENRQLTHELVANRKNLEKAVARKTLALRAANRRLSEKIAAHKESIQALKQHEELSSLLKTKSSFVYQCLTPMEIQVADLVKQGFGNKQIADVLNLSRRTVEVHRYNIRKKLQLDKTHTNLKTFLASME